MRGYAWWYYPNAPYEDGSCGPDVSVALDNTLTEISSTTRTWSKEWSDNEKKASCDELHDIPEAFTAWDIGELLFIGSDTKLPEGLWVGVKNGKGGLPVNVPGKDMLPTGKDGAEYSRCWILVEEG